MLRLPVVGHRGGHTWLAPTSAGCAVNPPPPFLTVAKAPCAWMRVFTTSSGLTTTAETHAATAAPAARCRSGTPSSSDMPTAPGQLRGRPARARPAVCAHAGKGRVTTTPSHAVGPTRHPTVWQFGGLGCLVGECSRDERNDQNRNSGKRIKDYSFRTRRGALARRRDALLALAQGGAGDPRVPRHLERAGSEP